MIQNVILGIPLVVILGVLILILKRLSDVKHQTENTGQDALDSLREDVSRSEREIKDEVRSNQMSMENRLTTQLELVRTSVDNRLEAVHETAGAMQNLAAEIGDVKKILANVSTRGVLGERQLKALLEQFLTPDQYGENVRPHAGSERVEFAIRLPGNNGDPNSCVWLPIDSKFPIADYQRILEAVEKVDKDAEKKAVHSFVQTIKSEAKRINKKYVSPPNTTEFAIMFLPTESLYAEILRQPGQVEELLQNYKVIVAGPTNFAAIVISLRVGFDTLTIQKRSGEITEVLSAVKVEFQNFDLVIKKLERLLRSATDTVESVARRKRAMVRKLREVEEVPQEDAAKTLGLPSVAPADDS